jgi:hypothetical protein
MSKVQTMPPIDHMSSSKTEVDEGVLACFEHDDHNNGLRYNRDARNGLEV